MLLFIAIILLLSLLAINLSDRAGFPSLFLFLVLGIIGSQLGADFENYQFSEHFSTIALIVIIFYGGFGTSWKMGKPVVKEAITLAGPGVVLTALITGAFVYWVLKFDFLESLLLASIVASTDYASVSNILTSQKLNLKYNSASLLELESGSNDPSAYTMTILFLSLIAGTDISVPLLILKQVGFGAAAGLFFAFLVKELLKIHDLKKNELAIVFMFAAALFTYSLTDLIGGNGYLAVYIFGISVGDMEFKGKKDITFFFDGLTELMNILLFFLLGLLATPVRILKSLPVALAIMLFMTFVSRPVSVYALMAPFKLKKEQLLIISWAGLKGAASIAFAILAINSGLSFGHDIYHIVFGICLLSSLIQGSLMPVLTKKLNMIDERGSVLRTFNYYADKGDISFIKATIEEDSPFVGNKVSESGFQGDFVIAKIIRDGKNIVPRGEVVINANDQVVVVGEEYFDPNAQDLKEFTITSTHLWCDKKLQDLQLPQNQLILSINRDGQFIRVEGKTEIKAGDRVVLFEKDN